MTDDQPKVGAATEVPRPAEYPWCTRSCGAADRSASRPVRRLRLGEVRGVPGDSATVATFQLSTTTDVPAPDMDTVCTATAISCHLEEAYDAPLPPQREGPRPAPRPRPAR